MMNDFKKSESPIQAMKSANKAVMTAAESMEQRGDIKGNASTTITHRTQCRESVSSGLARVRKLAKEQPKLRFTLRSAAFSPRSTADRSIGQKVRASSFKLLEKERSSPFDGALLEVRQDICEASFSFLLGKRQYARDDFEFAQ